MITRKIWIGALCVFCLPISALPQENPPAAATTSSAAPVKPDYSKEPFVFEHYATKVRYEDDGTGDRDSVASILLQTDAGVQALGELTFGYNSVNEQLNVQYVRVRKPDGSVVTADPSAIKEMTPDVERDAPVYTDYKEKHITVPSLQPGDTLEYDIDTRFTTPLAAGEFWYSQNFLKEAIVLDESLEVNLPENRAVNIASPAGSYDTAHDSGRVIYTWKHVQLTPPASDNSGDSDASGDQQKQAEDAKSALPDVQFTTFKSWGGVAKWYAALEQGRSDPTPAIRAKVTELTQGKTTDAEKVQPLYDYIAKNIRYVSLSFGLGRYQPHTAGEVFTNKYGDCKDKATLLAAMMRAAGIASDVALIPATSKLDETMPSPSQFDHVITAIPQGNELIWLDSTTEVAPFRMLAVTLRDKSALLVTPDGKGRIVHTPADPPFASTQLVEIAGTVSDLGKLTGTVHYSVRGDQELFLRLAFRHTAQSNWKQIGSAILQQDGLDGDATAVEASDPSDTRTPFDITIHFTQDDFLPWTSKEPTVKLPLLSIGLPAAADDNAAPIELGSPLAVTVHLKLTLPAGFKARAPVGIAVSRDYADFKSSYTLDGQTLAAERVLNFKMRQLPADRTSDYLAFSHAVSSDEIQALHLQNSSTGAPQIPQAAKVEDVMDAAEVALHGDDPQTAIPLLHRVIDLDPKKYEKSVYNDLGIAYAATGKYDDSVAAFHKQLEIDPYDQNTNRYLALAFARQGKFDDAIAAYRKQLEINPLDLLAISQLGFTLNLQHKYAEAVPELEKASTIAPDDAAIEVGLGSAYLNTGANDKALEAFDRAGQLSRTPSIWNDVAYELADNRLQLDKAQQYAESAVAATAANLRNIDLAHANVQQYQLGESLAAFWDTLGWVYFQQGDAGKGLRYVRASWLVSESGTVGDHVGQILAKQGMKDQAAVAYAQALAARRPDPDTRAHMILLLGGNTGIDAMVERARPTLVESRTINLGKPLDAKAEATFELLLSPAGADGSSTQVDEVKFVSGSDSLHSATDALRFLSFGGMFPDASPVKLLQLGTLSCAASGECTFTLTAPEDVHSIN
jgi:tetratricopeptide (TPR) repeat protein/transglutaminase-like putative cysteine protease